MKKRNIVLASLAFVSLSLPVAYVTADKETRDLDDAARQSAGGSFVRLSDGVTHYELSGEAGRPTVVLVHGGTIPLWNWDLQAPALRDAGLRVLRYDHYGRGFSDRPAVAYDRELYRRQLLELLDALAIDGPVDLVGISFGAATVASFTAAHPERVRRLVFMAPVLDYAAGRTLFTIARVPGVGEVLMRVVGVPRSVDRTRAFFAEAHLNGDYGQRFAEQVGYRGYARSLLSMMRSDALGDYRAVYRQVGARQTPALLIWGDADPEIPRAHVEEIRDVISGIKYHELAGAGHGPNLQHPEAVNRLLVSFLARQDRGGN
jgi:pimeloyl-ACP methyl ester carboxylesterase